MSRPRGSLHIIEACTQYCCPARNILKQEKCKDSGWGVWGQRGSSAVMDWPSHQKTQVPGTPLGFLQLCKLAVCHCIKPSSDLRAQSRAFKKQLLQVRVRYICHEPVGKHYSCHSRGLLLPHDWVQESSLALHVYPRGSKLPRLLCRTANPLSHVTATLFHLGSRVSHDKSTRYAVCQKRSSALMTSSGVDIVGAL